MKRLLTHTLAASLCLVSMGLTQDFFPKDKGVGVPIEGATFTYKGVSSGVGSYDIYLSEDEAAVKNAADKTGDAYVTTVEEKLEFKPSGKFEMNKTYYWRADRRKGNNFSKGDVMSFTTINHTIVTRLNGGKPIIHKDMPGTLGEAINPKHEQSHNIDGPSMMRVPDWIPAEKRAHPDAVYYLYFAHHSGKHIRMAWAKDIEGPYTVYNPGMGVAPISIVENLLWSGGYGHIASPDIHIDEEKKQFIMYVHGSNDHAWKYWQSAVALVSDDGLNFRRIYKDGPGVDGIVSAFYVQAFEYKGDLFGITNFGYTFKARYPKDPFNADTTGDGVADIRIEGKERDYLWEEFKTLKPKDDGSIRHAAVERRGDTLHVWFSQRGAKPERIRHSTIDLTVGIENWELGPVTDILLPELDWEGADLNLNKSGNGAGIKKRELRDPEVFTDIDGKKYLLYTGRGEEAIGIAIFNDTKDLKPVDIKRKNPEYWEPEISVQKTGWNIHLDNEESVTARLFDLKGKLIQTFDRAGGDILSIPKQDLTKGVYFVTLQFENRASKSYRLPPLMD